MSLHALTLINSTTTSNNNNNDNDNDNNKMEIYDKYLENHRNSKS